MSTHVRSSMYTFDLNSLFVANYTLVIFLQTYPTKLIKVITSTVAEHIIIVLSPISEVSAGSSQSMLYFK